MDAKGSVMGKKEGGSQRKVAEIMQKYEGHSKKSGFHCKCYGKPLEVFKEVLRIC